MTTKKKPAPKPAVNPELVRLLKTPVPVLRKRLAATGRDPAGLSRDALVKALANAVETPPATRKVPRTRAENTKPRDPRLPATGTVITREYKGKTYKVEVLDRGFKFDGKEWRSLSAIALAITKYKAISGTLFFGIATRKAK